MARKARIKLPTDPRGRRGAGTVRIKGKAWQARWSEAGQRMTQSGFTTKDAALDFLRTRHEKAVVARGLEDLGLKPAETKPVTAGTFADLVSTFLEARTVGEHRSVKDDRNRWSRHLAPSLDERTPSSISEGEVAALATKIKSTAKDGAKAGVKVSGATVQRCLHLLSAFYSWGQLHHGFTSNPAKVALKLPSVRKLIGAKPDSASTPFLEHRSDVVKLFKALPEPVSIHYALGAMAGLRPGEATGLEWSAVDLVKGVIHVCRQVRDGIVGIPKSGKDRRVDVLPGLLEVLKDWRERNPNETLVCPPVGVRGGFLSHDYIAEEFSKALVKAKLPALTEYQAGRHSFASLWVLAGNDILRLSKLLGHSSVTVTERYAHLTKRLSQAETARADFSLVA